MTNEYVKLNSTPADLMSAGNQLVAKGAALSEAMAPLIDHITSLESSSVVGADSFAADFLKNYSTTGANKSCKEAGSGDNSFGDVAQTYGNAIVSAMFNYLDSDTASSSDINGTTT